MIDAEEPELGKFAEKILLDHVWHQPQATLVFNKSFCGL